MAVIDLTFMRSTQLSQATNDPVIVDVPGYPNDHTPVEILVLYLEVDDIEDAEYMQETERFDIEYNHVNLGDGRTGVGKRVVRHDDGLKRQTNESYMVSRYSSCCLPGIVLVFDPSYRNLLVESVLHARQKFYFQ